MTRGRGSNAASDPGAKAESARRIVSDSLDTLSQQLAAGNSRQLDAFLRVMGRFHRYSFGNILLIVSQRPDATRVAGFHTWRSLGRTVRKGEKGIAIFAPMRLKARKDDTSVSGKASSARDDGVEDKTFIRFRVVHVFDIAQTEGDPLPEPARIGGDPGEALARLEHAVRTSGIILNTVDTLGAADGVSRGGTIELREGMSEAERFSVLVHEWAHELLHHAGQSTEPDKRPSKTVRETEAEAVAFVVSQSIGLDTNTASADYIRMYAGDPETLAASLDRIQRTACTIIDAIEQDPTNAPTRTTRPSEPPHIVAAHVRARRQR
ncbi:MAG: ArdC family protein [Phycisphaerales bacterium]